MRAILIKMAILVIALAMVVGVASAAPAEVRITPASQTIPYEPDYVTYNVDVYDIFDHSAQREIFATIFYGSDVGHLEFNFTNSTGASSGWIGHGTSWNWGTPQITYSCPTGTCGYENLTMDVKAVTGAPEGVEYGIMVNDSQYGTWGMGDQARGTTWGTSIPEFATIAIPVAAILGLLFFFNHRKRRKE